MIAALYVQTGGAYFGLPDVDPWDELRRMGVELMGKRERAATPPAFRDLLISLARSARRAVEAA